jgi:hypothetical protein
MSSDISPLSFCVVSLRMIPFAREVSQSCQRFLGRAADVCVFVVLRRPEWVDRTRVTELAQPFRGVLAHIVYVCEGSLAPVVNMMARQEAPPAKSASRGTCQYRRR